MEEILLCTHDPILVKSLYGILRDKGHDVEIADHLALAIQLILKGHYYAVIIDGKPFGLSVEDAVQIMKTVSPEMPIIVVGGPECGTDAFSIRMPVDLEEFRDVLYTMHQSNKIHKKFTTEDTEIKNFRLFKGSVNSAVASSPNVYTLKEVPERML
jgi:DNA-binding NtrC family response regulator